MSDTDVTSAETSPLVSGFGKQLRKVREHRGFSREKLGQLTGFSASTIGAFERGERIPDERAASALDAALNAHQALACVGKDLEREQYPKKFDEWFRLEASAISLRTYDTQAVNGLLQTERYARAVFQAWAPHFTKQRIEDLVEERLARQTLLAREPLASLCFVLDEAVLHRTTGNSDVMREQLGHLLSLSDLHHVRVLALPFDSQPVPTDGPMTLLETPEHRVFGYVEAQGQSSLIADKETVSAWHQRFGMIQVNALRPADSARLIQRRLEEL